MKVLCSTLFVLFSSCVGFTQTDTLIQLSPVTIHSTRHLSIYEQQLDVAPIQAQNLSDVLGRQGALFVKSNGLGSLATISVQGASTSQTRLMWNGIPIQSPMLGLTDLSLFPTGLLDQLALSNGGQSATSGSGAIGGVLSLDNAALKNDRLISGVAEGGSFGHSRFLIKGAVPLHSKVFIRTRFLRQSSENNFPFQIREDLPVRRQSNAQIEQTAILQEVSWQVTNTHQINIYAWWQNYEKSIPPSTVQNISEARQEDDILRLTANWKYSGKNHIWQSRVAWFKEDIFYADPRILLEAPSSFRTIYSSLEYQHFAFKNWQFKSGFNGQRTIAYSTGYPDGSQEVQWALHGKITRQLSRHWKLHALFRQGIIDSDLLPFIPSVSIEKKFNSGLNMALSLNRNYRNPTLNDKYWGPGGNIDLKPERGWSGELKTRYTSNNERFTTKASFFNRSIEDWILWHPSEVANYWEAENLGLVWSRGFDIQQELTHQVSKKTILKSTLRYQYVKSTNQIKIEQPDFAEGSQLLYVPVHQVGGSLTFRSKYWSVDYQHQFTGKYQGVNTSLSAYHVGHLVVDFSFLLGVNKITTFARINNIWNAQYRVIERQVTPGRHFRVGIQFDIESQKTKTKPQ